MHLLKDTLRLLRSSLMLKLTVTLTFTELSSFASVVTSPFALLVPWRHMDLALIGTSGLLRSSVPRWFAQRVDFISRVRVTHQICLTI